MTTSRPRISTVLQKYRAFFGRLLETSRRAMNDDLWSYPDSVGRLDSTGFDAEAVDGDIGTVDGTSLEAGAGYLVIDTGRWIFGKKAVHPGRARRACRSRRRDGVHRQDEGRDRECT